MDMEGFTVIIDSKEYFIEPGLHEGIYSVSQADQSALVGRDQEGNWKLHLPTSDAIDFPVKEIGAGIERHFRH